MSYTSACVGCVGDVSWLMVDGVLGIRSVGVCGVRMCVGGWVVCEGVRARVAVQLNNKTPLKNNINIPIKINVISKW